MSRLTLNRSKAYFVCVNLPRPRLNRGQLHSNNLRSGSGQICQHIKDPRTAKYDNRNDGLRWIESSPWVTLLLSIPDCDLCRQSRCAQVQRRAHFSAFVDNHIWYAEHLCTCAGEEELVAWGLDYHRFITTDASEHSPPRCTVRVPTLENIQKSCSFMQ